MDRIKDIERRIEQNLVDHEKYRFTRLMNSAVKSFLDLALEYSALDDFIWVAVLLPRMVMGWETSLYLMENGDEAVLAADTRPEVAAQLAGGRRITVDPSAAHQPPEEYRVPLHNRGAPRDAHQPDSPSTIGLLAVRSGQILEENELFFLRKYADILALSLTRRFLADKNQQHIDFIKKLVADIGHNVIVPNIFFKAYLRRLSGKIDRLKEVQAKLADLTMAAPQDLPSAIRDLAAEMDNANEGLLEEFDHIQKHYLNTSLFLETLLRQSHFEKGYYVLKKKTCNFRQDIIEPQVERYRHRLQERGINIDLSMGGVPDAVIEAVVDIGLISQVFSNLMSNAIKYTRPVNQSGWERKFIAYGLELIPDAFGPGGEGVKINLFSSGPPLDPEEVDQIFTEGYRGKNIGSERGTGHGLFFVKEVVELHRGRVGYEATPRGNNFYFILPR